MKTVQCDYITHQLVVPAPDENLEQNLFVQIDPEKCTGCGRCQSWCPTQSIFGEMGLSHKILHPEPCIHCGQCLVHCPDGAIYETCSWLEEVEEKLADPDAICIAMPAPSLRFSLGEAFGQQPGINSPGQMLTALEMLGFDHVWDLRFAADVTIWEEGSEFIERYKKSQGLPMLSSCCSSWQKYAQYFYPKLLKYFSDVKSPMAINGRLSKTYGADRFEYPVSHIYTVAIVPCVSKKYEALQPDLAIGSQRDIDAVLTTRELAWLLQKHNIDLPALKPGIGDSLMGEAGAGNIFGVSGGVLQSLSRFVYQKMTGKKFEKEALRCVRTGKSIKEYELKAHGETIRLASVFGAANFPEICEAILDHSAPWHFVEFMACPSGCINGGGQPLLPQIRNKLIKR